MILQSGHLIKTFPNGGTRLKLPYIPGIYGIPITGIIVMDYNRNLATNVAKTLQTI